EGKLCQIFINLLMNAAQAIDEGAPRTQSISVRSSTDPRGWALVEIRDTGCGIPPEELTKIFNPFFTTKREGMGLGLSICQRIVTSWGGSISAESEVGRGTTFRVALPPHDADAESVAVAAPIEPSTSKPSARMRLLVIDDEPALLRVLDMALSSD